MLIYAALLLLIGNSIESSPECRHPARWTRFYNRDRPSVTGDYETLGLLRKENPGEICDNPLSVDGRLIDGRPWQAGGENVVISTNEGLYCRNHEQSDRFCQDYKVRFCCSESSPECRHPARWTRFYNRDRPSVTGDYETLGSLRRENPGRICATPTSVDGRLIDGRPWQAGGEVLTVSATAGLYCKNLDQRDRLCNDYKVRFCCPGTAGFPEGQ